MANSAEFFQCGPRELISIIFESCKSGRDVRALAATCRSIRAIWRAMPSRYRLAWGADIVCFEEALIASRTAQVIASSVGRDGTSCAGLYPGDYSSTVKEPTKKDMRAVFGLDRMAAFLEREFCCGDVSLPADRRFTRGTLPEAPERLLEWSWRVRKAIYRSLIVGAALAPVYWEPLRQAHADPDEEMQRIGPYDLELSDKQIRFLTKFPVYNLAATSEEEDAAFGQTARWIVQQIMQDHTAREEMARRFEQCSGRAERCQLEGDCCVRLLEVDGSHADAHFLAWELAQILWAHFHIDTCIDHDEYYEAQPVPEGTVGGRARVVLFGIFGAEDLIVPELDLETHPLINGYNVPQPSLGTSGSSQILPNSGHSASFIPYASQVFCRSGIPNMSTEFGQLPPLDLKWFSYTFDRFLGVQFKDGMFEPAPVNFARRFFEAIAVFAHDDVAGRQLCNPDWGLGSGGLVNGVEILQASQPTDDLVFESMDSDGIYPFW
ncbi:hypothetical protein IF1G_01431 [Cordyceps javanica]|uniref:Uncharacterized protein n=1 Tax=Cordyceps javanica TaxID=43265 RepID=A0A545VBW5_9HYPO|nr:hypothetical protein IF1G_01431 [Cordyceps javanica]TQW11109.1 hypothetical protein IF2G_02051 [Cordyceps javanica]